MDLARLASDIPGPGNLGESLDQRWCILSTRTPEAQVETDEIQEYLIKLDIDKSLMHPKGVHPQVLRELADDLARQFSIVFKGSW